MASTSDQSGTNSNSRDKQNPDSGGLIRMVILLLVLGSVGYVGYTEFAARSAVSKAYDALNPPGKGVNSQEIADMLGMSEPTQERDHGGMVIRRYDVTSFVQKHVFYAIFAKNLKGFEDKPMQAIFGFRETLPWHYQNADEMLAISDKNSDGKVARDEVGAKEEDDGAKADGDAAEGAGGGNATDGEETDGKLKAWFKTIDGDDDGFLTKEELETFIKSRKGGGGGEASGAEPNDNPDGGGGGGRGGRGGGRGGRGGGRGGRGGGGGFDPAAMIKRIMENDKDKDGKLSKDEASDRMKNVFADVDADKDGFVTEEELKARFANRGGGGRGGRGGQGRGGRGGPGGGGPGAGGPGGGGPGGQSESGRPQRPGGE